MIYLIRHAKASPHGADYDHLSNTGFLQAKHLGKFFKHHLDKQVYIFTGTLRRHVQTSDTLLSQVKKIRSYKYQTEQLNEFSNALWNYYAEKLAQQDGGFSRNLSLFYTTRNDISQNILSKKSQESKIRLLRTLFFYLTRDILDAWQEDKIPPETIESFIDFEARLSTFLEKVYNFHAEMDIIVISSATPISWMLCHLLGMPRDKAFYWIKFLYNTSINTIIKQDKILHIETINTIPHLTYSKHISLW